MNLSKRQENIYSILVENLSPAERTIKACIIRWEYVYMLYEKLKSIENLFEGDEYSEGGVSYYITFYKIDDTISLDFALKNILLDMEAIQSFEENIVITPIKCPQNEIRKLCEEWHLREQISNKIISLIDNDKKMYRCCDDYEYISKGCVCEIFRIVENGSERILVDFYLVD